MSRSEARTHNAQAVAKVAKILKQHTDNETQWGGRKNMETDVSDLLADMLHYCTAKRLDFDDCLRRAHSHHDAERLEAGRPPRGGGK